MRRNHNTGGFTLLEMTIVIVAASLVTLAATTMMLFGLRSNNRSMDESRQQTTARMLLDTLESLSTKGTIARVDANAGSWQITNLNDQLLYSYDSDTSTIYAGQDKAPVMENVIASDVNLSNYGVLTFSLETEEGTYTSSVYCRNAKPQYDGDDITDDLGQSGGTNIEDIVDDSQNAGAVEAARIEFLRKLANQYKLAGGQVNNGLILDSGKISTGEYYSEWYIGGYGGNPGWNAMTPWCACFLSWGLAGMVDEGKIEDSSRPLLASGDYRKKWYASVDDFVYYFQSTGSDRSGHYWLDNLEHSYVRPGDLIVFDWNLDKDPSHIGAVLLVNAEEGRVYTIEGNTSNRVGVRSYKLSDPRILGYGVIDWAVPSAS